MRGLLMLARSLAGVTFVEPETRWRKGFSVRHDWLDGTHDLVGFRRTRRAAERSLRGAANYWRPGPVRPTCSVVEVSYRDWALHRRRRDCRAPDCAAGAQPTTHPARVAR
jgi:hypothetical protein